MGASSNSGEVSPQRSRDVEGVSFQSQKITRGVHEKGHCGAGGGGYPRLQRRRLSELALKTVGQMTALDNST